MGTRLYPVTTDPRVLERLAGVPAGTYNDLESLKKRMADKPYREFADKVWHDRDLRLLDMFLSFGWGRVDSRICPDCCGDTKWPRRMAEILEWHNVDLNGVSIDELDGLEWN